MQKRLWHILANAIKDIKSKLADLINQYESGDNTKKPELSQQILSEIDMLWRKNLKPKANAERPLSIVGNIRGTERPQGAPLLDVAKHAVEISSIVPERVFFRVHPVVI
jgi:hypothetical protein